MEAWRRRTLVLAELLRYNADIMCLQEVDEKAFSRYLEPQLAAQGEASWKLSLPAWTSKCVPVFVQQRDLESVIDELAEANTVAMHLRQARQRLRGAGGSDAMDSGSMQPRRILLRQFLDEMRREAPLE